MTRYPRKHVSCKGGCGRTLRSTKSQRKGFCFSCDDTTGSHGVPVAATNYFFSDSSSSSRSSSD